MLPLIFLGIAVLLYILGYVIKNKKTTWMISGYNTLPKEEKEKYDIDKLTYYVGNFIYVLAFIWALITLAIYILPDEIFIVTIVGVSLQLIAIVVGIIYLNTNNRVKK